MVRDLLPDDLWEFMKPFIPPRKRRFRHPGRKPIGDRPCMTGIIFILRTGLPWEYLPKELGCGSGVTCWRRLRDWQKAGVFENIRRALLDRLNEAGLLDWEHAIVDSASLRAVGAGGKNGAQPHRSAQTGFETSPSHRGERRSSVRGAHRCQPQRRHPTPSSG